MQFDGNNPDDPGGWATFLNLQFNQTLIATIRPQVSQYTYIQLYNDFGLYADIQTKTSVELSRQLRASLGGDFFCGPSYVFDGDADGKLDGSGCPPIEIIIKQIKPTEPQFIANLETIVANQEALRVIQSDKDRALRRPRPRRRRRSRRPRRRRRSPSRRPRPRRRSRSHRRRPTGRPSSRESRRSGRWSRRSSRSSRSSPTRPPRSSPPRRATRSSRCRRRPSSCRTLTELGVDCAEYFKAINWRPSIILGDAADANLLIDATPDAPPVSVDEPTAEPTQ